MLGWPLMNQVQLIVIRTLFSIHQKMVPATITVKRYCTGGQALVLFPRGLILAPLLHPQFFQHNQLKSVKQSAG
jgi:hypothetical protein